MLQSCAQLLQVPALFQVPDGHDDTQLQPNRNLPAAHSKQPSAEKHWVHPAGHGRHWAASCHEMPSCHVPGEHASTQRPLERYWKAQAVQFVADVQLLQPALQSLQVVPFWNVAAGHESTQVVPYLSFPAAQVVHSVAELQAVQPEGQSRQVRSAALTTVRAGQDATHVVPYRNLFDAQAVHSVAELQAVQPVGQSRQTAPSAKMSPSSQVALGQVPLQMFL